MEHIFENKSFLDCRVKGKHFYFSKQTLPVITWDDVIACFNLNAINKLEIRELGNYGIVLHNYTGIDHADTLLKYYSKLDPVVSSSAHVYISFLETSNTFGKHKDTSDVLFWQAIVSTHWVIEDNGSVFNYILKQNELIYVPRGMYHSVTPLTPRVGISLGLDY